MKNDTQAKKKKKKSWQSITFLNFVNQKEERNLYSRDIYTAK